MKYGHSLMEMGKLEESLAWHKKAIKIDPFFVVAYLNLGRTYAKVC